MQDSDRMEFAKVVLGFAELKGKKLSAPAVDLYWRAMQHWDIDEFKQAAEELLRTCEFMPTPKEFEDLRKAASGMNADEAWLQLLSNHGYCDDEIGARALASLGGWAVVGFTDLTRLPWLKERFREAYENFEDSADAVEALPLLAGGERSRLNGPQPISRLLGRDP